MQPPPPPDSAGRPPRPGPPRPQPPRPQQPRPNDPQPNSGWQPQAGQQQSWQQQSWQQPGAQQPAPQQPVPPNAQQPNQQQWQQQQWQQRQWQQQQWQQQQRQPGPYGYRPYGYKRRRSPWLVSMLIFGPLLVVGIVAIVLVVSLAGIGTGASPQGGSVPQTTASPSAQVSGAQQPVPQTKPKHGSKPASHPTTKAEPTKKTKPTKKKPGTKHTSKPGPPTRPDLRKQQGYEKIPLPVVSTSPSAARKLVADDTLYFERVAKHRCTDGPPINLYPYPSLSRSAMQFWLQRIADCDQAMWAGPVAKAGFQATKVRVRLITSGKTHTPCGTQTRGELAAFYCSANQELYVDPALGNPKAARTYDWGQYWEVVSHEYGHAIQARTGILASASVLESAASSTAAADQISRRIELQAQCFAGLAVTRVGGMSTARFEQQVRFETSRGMSATHGTGEHQAAWFAQGHKYAALYQCDTFRIAGSEVS